MEVRAVDCCQDLSGRNSQGVGRRTFLRGMLGGAFGALMASPLPAGAQAKKIRLAFCSQLLCIVPYEVARARGHFQAEGLDVELIYTRGGTAAMQAMIGGAVEYAATSFDVALSAFARGAQVRRFASTGRLPLFALATSPSRAREIPSLKELEDRTVGVSALGNADHVLALYLLKQAGADVRKVRFAILGPNLFDALRLGQIDAGMVQEPALSLLAESGARVLMNAMDLEDARKHLGGPYEFMGVAFRAGEREARLEEMRRLARALEKGLQATHALPAAAVADALPKEAIAGGDKARIVAILERYRGSLYPSGVKIDVEACVRVADSQKAAGILGADVDARKVLDLSIAGS
ncbi:MAG: ABC transporter substrate-binding protein [Nitrospinota bacterium]